MTIIVLLIIVISVLDEIFGTKEGDAATAESRLGPDGVSTADPTEAINDEWHKGRSMIERSGAGEAQKLAMRLELDERMMEKIASLMR